MNHRLALVSVAVLGLTAFAPAPFPKTSRRPAEPEISLQSFQGRWRVVAFHVSRADGKHVEGKLGCTHIRILNNRWSFTPNDHPSSTLLITIDASKELAKLRFFTRDDPDKSHVHGMGLIRRQGDRLQVLYRWGDEKRGLLSFDPPVEGVWILTLQKE